VNDAPLDVLLCSIGSVGDLNPFLAIGVEARRRGHSATVLANEIFADAVQRTGCEFISVQSAEMRRRLYSDPASWTYSGGYRRLLHFNTCEPMPRLHRAIVQRYVPGRTVVAASYQAFGARVARETHGVPTATVHYDPHTLRSIRGVHKMPPPMLLGRWVPAHWIRIQYWFADKFFADPLVAPSLNAFRRPFGLPPVQRITRAWWNSPDAVLAMFPDWWGPPQPEWPSQTILTGFPVFDAAEVISPDDDLVRFLAAGDAPIVFSPGASSMHNRRRFSEIIEACRRLGRRGLLISPNVEAVPQPLPTFMHHCRYAPFTTLLRHAAAVVHHAGIGTTAACLRAGLPQVCVPGIYNQPDAAERLRRLGVSQTVLPRQFTVDRLTTALGKLLDSDDVAHRCREIAGWFGPPDAAARQACDVLESLARQASPALPKAA
jgi:rhamnosyltransferase subunit B